MPAVELSPLDEERFGVRTGKAVVANPAGVRRVMDDVRALGVRLLIARCPADQLLTAQALEASGGRIMDVLVYYSVDLRAHPIPDEPDGVTIRSSRPEDADGVAAVARQAFKGYLFGHYHADPRLSAALADEVYVSWAHRSCLSREVAAKVLIAESEDGLLGFFSMRRNSDEEMENLLCGVLPTAQGRGIFRTFTIHGMTWSLAQGASRLLVSTQVTNHAVQKVWMRLGFEPDKSYLTFHTWFGDDAQ